VSYTNLARKRMGRRPPRTATRGTAPSEAAKLTATEHSDIRDEDVVNAVLLTMSAPHNKTRAHPA